MSYTYHGTTDLIALPNRTVQTYPSGLVRVERSFVCRKSQAETYRRTIKIGEKMPLDDGTPAIDGLYIFPDPSEVVRDDGFVEFRVTAYGRTNIFSDIAIQKSSSLGTYNLSIQDIPPAADLNVNLPAINDIFIIRGVLPSSEPTATITQRPTIENPTVIVVETGLPLELKNIVLPGTIEINNAIVRRQQIVSISISLDSYSSTSFGRWSEYAVTWRAQGYSRTFFV